MKSIIQKCRDSGRWLQRGVRLLPDNSKAVDALSLMALIISVVSLVFVATHNHRRHGNNDGSERQPEGAPMQLLTNTNLQKLANNDGKPFGFVFELLATNSAIILCHRENDKIMLQLWTGGLRDGVHAESGSEHGEFTEPFLWTNLSHKIIVLILEPNEKS
jgi:hypothetical protein